ncbi:MAG: hypothetical protein H6836_05475 [Planctomycetes bacterium]|nr:hypothetical protein [Planctomycetota bacterium]
MYRIWITTWVLAGAAGLGAQDHAQATTTSAADRAIATLKAGNQRFAAGTPRTHDLGEGTRRTLARAQQPLAIVVTCAESSVVPEHVFDTGLGQIVVVRTSGAACDPATLASIEVAATQYGVPLCVVMGHTHCDAVRAAVRQGRTSHAQQKLLERLHPAVERARREGHSGADLLRHAEREGAYLTIEEAMRRSAVLGALAKTHKLTFRAALFDAGSGKVEWLKERQPTTTSASDDPNPEVPHIRGLPPHVALSLLRAGHQRFLSLARTQATNSRSRAAATREAQPLAVVLTCSDARVVPEMIFDAGLGELAVVRVAGNVASDEVVASVERAVLRSGASLCVVLGHDGCGVLQTAAQPGSSTHSPSLRAVLARIAPAIERARRLAPGAGFTTAAVEQNAVQAVADLRASPILKRLEQRGTLSLLAAVYQLESGDLSWPKVDPPQAAATTDHHAGATGHQPNTHVAGHGRADHGHTSGHAATGHGTDAGSAHDPVARAAHGHGTSGHEAHGAGTPKGSDGHGHAAHGSTPQHHGHPAPDRAHTGHGSVAAHGAGSAHGHGSASGHGAGAHHAATAPPSHGSHGAGHGAPDAGDHANPASAHPAPHGETAPPAAPHGETAHQPAGGTAHHPEHAEHPPAKQSSNTQTQLLLTVTTAALLTIAGLLALLVWQRRG